MDNMIRERIPHMFQPIFLETEVAYRQQHVRADFIQAQRQISIAGVRQILGNTVLEMGSRIYGVTQGSCNDAAEIRGMVRNTLRVPLPLKPGG